MILLLAAALPAAAADNTIGFGGYKWDPLLGFPTGVAVEMRTQSYPAGARGLWVVQCTVPLTSQVLDLIGATGFQAAVGDGVGALLWVGTTEQAGRVRALSFVRYVDYLYPFEKGNYTPSWVAPRNGPGLRLLFDVGFANVDGIDVAVADIASYGDVIHRYASGTGTVVVKESDFLRLLRNPYLIYAYFRGTSRPDLYAVLPRSALPGQRVIISGVDFRADDPPHVTFRNVEAPRVLVRDAFRIEAEVPSGLEPGPADIVVRLSDGFNQIFPGSDPGGFSVAAPGGITLATGDVVEGEFVPFPLFEGGFLRFRWNDGQGLPRMLSEAGPTALAFDGDGRLLVATYKGSTWYDPALQVTASGPAEANNATALVFDRDNNLIVVTYTRVYRFSPTGVLLSNTGGGGFDADLDSDQCTLYLSGTPIQRLNVCTMTPLSPIAGTTSDGLRVLPDGTLLTVQGEAIRRYRADGTLVASMEFGPFLSLGNGMALSSDATYVRIGGSQARFDLASNRLSVASAVSFHDDSFALAIYGGWTAGRGFASYAGSAAEDVAAADVPLLTPALLAGLVLALAAVAVRARQ
jgi:hypothetical protein